MLLLPSAHRLFVYRVWELCMCVVRPLRGLESASWWESIIPREQRRTAEGAGSSSGRGHCSRGQSTPARLLVFDNLSWRTIGQGTHVGDAGLDLRRALPRRAVGRDLVQRGGHFGGLLSCWSKSWEVHERSICGPNYHKRVVCPCVKG